MTELDEDDVEQGHDDHRGAHGNNGLTELVRGAGQSEEARNSTIGSYHGK